MTKEVKSDYKVLGLMAGSSMDGLDIAEVLFTKKEKWSFDLRKCKTFEYDKAISSELQKAFNESKASQEKIDELFGSWIAQKILDFDSHEIDLVGVHGHTLIHEPKNSISWQLGSGRIISNQTKLPVVSDFRSLDVSLGGQGAPLVPVGDFELFEVYDACLNLGGIANISIKKSKIAWDVCPCNQVLNYFSRKMGHDFDSDGLLASCGNMDSAWLKKIESNPYFFRSLPKSLPNSFLSNEVLDKINPQDGLRSYSTFVVKRILDDLSQWINDGDKVLIAGGGAFNSFLIKLLRQNTLGLDFFIPEKKIIEFKEAIIFGFLGVLKMRNEINVLASVTGASRDTSSGVIHYPK